MQSSEGKTRLLHEKGLDKKPNKINSLTSKKETYNGNVVSWVTKHLKTLHLLFGGNSLNILGCGGEKNTTPWEFKISLIVHAEGITKKKRKSAELPKMFETQSERCLVKLFQKYFWKRPVGMEKSQPFYLQPIVIPLTNINSTVSMLWLKIWYKILTLFLEDTFFEKPQGGASIWPPPQSLSPPLPIPLSCFKVKVFPRSNDICEESPIDKVIITRHNNKVVITRLIVQYWLIFSLFLKFGCYLLLL